VSEKTLVRTKADRRRAVSQLVGSAGQFTSCHWEALSRALLLCWHASCLQASESAPATTADFIYQK